MHAFIQQMDVTDLRNLIEDLSHTAGAIQRVIDDEATRLEEDFHEHYEHDLITDEQIRDYAAGVVTEMRYLLTSFMQETTSGRFLKRAANITKVIELDNRLRDAWSDAEHNEPGAGSLEDPFPVQEDFVYVIQDVIADLSDRVKELS